MEKHNYWDSSAHRYLEVSFDLGATRHHADYRKNQKYSLLTTCKQLRVCEECGKQIAPYFVAEVFGALTTCLDCVYHRNFGCLDDPTLTKEEADSILATVRFLDKIKDQPHLPKSL